MTVIKTKGFLIKAVLFVLLGIFIFTVIQDLLVPDWDTAENARQTICGFNALEEEKISVLFLGASQVLYSVSPMEIYSSTGVLSYNLATQGQPIECSYYLLKYALETQRPKVVFVDASTLIAHEEDMNFYWRLILDVLPFSKAKVEMAQAYAEKWYSDGVMSAFLPIIKYHTRWQELSDDDFKKIDNDTCYAAGGGMLSQTVSAAYSIENIDYWAEQIEALNNGEIVFIQDGVDGEKSDNTIIYDFEINSSTIDVLVKIKDLCDSYGIELVLFKMPMRTMPQYYSNSWMKKHSETVQRLSKELDITYLDLHYTNSLEVDFKTDTADAGIHLNVRGAEKVTKYVADFLIETYTLPSAESELYNGSLEKYQKAKEVALLESETNFEEYFNILGQNMDKWLIVIAANEEYTGGMDGESYDLMNALGLKLVENGKWMNSYIAVIDGGQVSYEALSEKRITYSSPKGEDIILQVTSAGWNSHSDVSIKINGTEYANGGNGLNIVVWDKESNLPIDSVSFNTVLQAKPSSKNPINIYNFFRNYEYQMCY